MKLNFIKEQADWVDNLTSNLISTIDETDFGIIDYLGTSINWEIGHIIIAKYFHSIQSVLDKDSEIIKEVNQKIPIDDIFKYYFSGNNPLSDWKNIPAKNQLLEFIKAVDIGANKAMGKLHEHNLIEETEIENPAAKTKYDTLTFTFKHQMWHNGQIAMIKRIIKEKTSR